MNDSVVIDFPSKSSEADASQILLNIAVVSEIKNNVPVSVTLNDLSLNVVGYLSLLSGIVPGVNLGDKVLISAVQDGVLIHGVVTPIDASVRASISFVEDMLVIEAQGAVALKSGKATVELTKAGEIRIDGKNVRTKARKTLTMLAGEVKLN
ncbi:MAG: hypothetical protein KJ795_02170 [Gammaproteobacteria bacterium]|nr:hypothetical protein [Gammaproteobacteria bacterium]MBU1776141.1 hypothetical protein [Gammaproteobacteria bacterium]